MKKPISQISRPTLSLIFLSAFCSSLMLIRYILTGELLGFGLIWNLFLAWVPIFFALLSRRLENQKKALSFVSLCLWLLFFPNAPYIITDLVHLGHLPGHLWWFDSLGIFMLALTGVLLGIYSLSIVHSLFENRFGKLKAWFLVIISLGLSGFGIYLGRFIRFNSWDLFTKPFNLIVSSLQELSNPLAIKMTLVFTFAQMALYLSFRILKNQPYANT